MRPQPITPAAPRAAGASSRRRGWAWLIFLSMAAAAAYFAAPWISQYTENSHGAAPKPAPRVIPVVTATARKGDIELYLTGLGTVTAFNTVTIRSRVDGELLSVAFTEGQTVQEGEPLAEIDPRTYRVRLSQAQGQLARDQALLTNAQMDLDRYRSLVANRSVTQQQVDSQLAIVKQFEGTVQTDQAQVDDAELQLSYCTIKAPIGGRIGLRLVDRGNMVRANDVGGLAVITQLQPITLVFTIPQDQISRVQKRANEQPDLLVEAYDREIKTRLATGSLLAIDNQVDTTTGAVRLKAVFQNLDNALFPNQFVNARLLVETRRGAVLIPSAAVQRGPTSTFVYVVKADRTVELRDVIVGPSEGDEMAIEDGLEPEEIVVTDGMDKLTPGAKIATRSTAAEEDAADKVAPRPASKAL